MFQKLKLIFQANAQIERYEVSNKFYNYKMEDNSSVNEHILRMSGYNNHLIQLGVNLPDDSVIDRILQSLPPGYKSFMMNYNMQGMDNIIPELFAMLNTAEVEIKKEHQVLMVNKITSFKKMLGLRDMKSPISSTAAKWRRIVLSVNIYSECLGTTTT